MSNSKQVLTRLKNELMNDNEKGGKNPKNNGRTVFGFINCRILNARITNNVAAKGVMKVNKFNKNKFVMTSVNQELFKLWLQVALTSLKLFEKKIKPTN